jgi:hypothetical protein
VKKAIADLGMEILLRVPHLSFVLQGEDTMNFKVKAPRVCSTCLHAYLHVYLHACIAFLYTYLHVVVAASFVVATATIVRVATANANADAHDARSDADVSARCY